MKTVLIAGSGYVGSALALKLDESGHRVYALRRSAASPGGAVLPLRADLTTGEGLAALPEQLDTIFYTIAADEFSEAAYRAAYVDGLQRLLGALKSPPRRLIYTSSTGVYAQDGGEWVDECSETRPARFSGQILLQGETVARESGVSAIVARLGGIYGPGRTRIVDSVRAGTAYALADRVQYLNLIHRDDCAGVLAHLMELAAPEAVYNAVDCSPVERGELIAWLAARLNVPVPPRRPATEAPDPQRGGNRRISNARLIASGYSFLYPDCRAGYAALI